MATWRHQILTEPLKVLSSSGIRGAKLIPFYNFSAQYTASFAWKPANFEFRSPVVRDTKLRSRLSKNTHLSRDFLGILKYQEKCLCKLFLGSVQIMSQLDAKVSSRQLLVYFPAAMWYCILEDQGPSTWRLHTIKRYNFARKISTNMSTLRQRTHLKLRELSSVLISFFLLRDNEHTI